MNKYDLSILIPARNEEFLSRTVEEILKNKRGKTEIIIGLDGEWANPPVPDHPDVTIFYAGKSIGQRAITNQICRLSKAKWVLKVDAHCAFDEGFDVKLLDGPEDDWTVIPTMHNLHGFDWICRSCGWKQYQGPSEKYGKCGKCGDKTEKEIIWKRRESRKSLTYRFDKTMHFQYWGELKDRPGNEGRYVETMSAQGSCFMITRKRYWDLNICDEKAGSWGQQGVEVAMKTWLSGGRLVTDRDTWYAHLFRTQGGDFSFPYPQSQREVEKAREFSRDLWINNKWDKALPGRDINWLLKKFYPVPDWHDGEVVNKLSNPSKGVIYYTDNQLNFKLAHKVRKQILKAGLPVVSTSLKPLDFGKNIHMKGMVRGWEAYFKQILTALENSDADIIYFCEHDWLYHPSHFDFTPERKDTFYYNWNWWRVRSQDGKAVRYDTQMVPGLVAYRELLLEYYRKVVAYLEKEGFTSENAHKVGFEPGTHNRVDFSGKYKVERFDSKFPLIDIRHGGNLTASKWSPDAFRSPRNARNWQETEEIPGWGRVKGRFQELINEI